MLFVYDSDLFITGNVIYKTNHEITKYKNLDI